MRIFKLGALKALEQTSTYMQEKIPNNVNKCQKNENFWLAHSLVYITVTEPTDTTNVYQQDSSSCGVTGRHHKKKFKNQLVLQFNW
jgi:hypothetical protein